MRTTPLTSPLPSLVSSTAPREVDYRDASMSLTAPMTSVHLEGKVSGLQNLKSTN